MSSECEHGVSAPDECGQCGYLEALESKLRKAREGLIKLGIYRRPNNKMDACCVCGYYSSTGHNPVCWLASLLKEIEIEETDHGFR